VQPGDLAIRTDGAGTFILTDTDPSQLANWTLLSVPTPPVASVNGYTGAVTLAKSDVGLGNVDNTSDAAKNAAVATLTNKRITKRVNDISAPGATPTLAWDSYDVIILRDINTAITSMSSGITGTPTQGQPWVVRFKDDGTGRAITWGASYRAVGVTLPTTTSAGKTIYVGGYYNATDGIYDAIAVSMET
jgi:hypothetical protein